MKTLRFVYRLCVALLYTTPRGGLFVVASMRYGRSDSHAGSRPTIIPALMFNVRPPRARKYYALEKRYQNTTPVGHKHMSANRCVHIHSYICEDVSNHAHSVWNHDDVGTC